MRVTRTCDHNMKREWREGGRMEEVSNWLSMVIFVIAPWYSLF